MDKTTTIIIGIVLILIMFGMGLSLIPDDFKNVLKHPKAIIIGLINQLILLPIVGFCILYIFPLEPEIAVGFMVLTACPGGAVSNLICYLSKADLALSVSLTAVSSIFAVFTIPLIIKFSLSHFLKEGNSITISLLETVGQIAIVVIIPIFLGMLVRKLKPNFALKTEKLVKIISIVALITLISGVLFKERHNLLLYIKEAGLNTLLLNTLTILIGFISAKAIRLKTSQALTIAIESGIQNSALAISIAIVLLQKTSYAVAPSIYTLSMYVTGSVIVLLSSKILSKTKSPCTISAGVYY